MKALTVCQPWAELIARGIKLVENRTWPTAYRGPLAIHAGKSRQWLMDPRDWHYAVELPATDALTFGALIAVVELVDCVEVEMLPADLRSHPFAEGPWCWVLRNAKRIGPIPCRGNVGLWDTDLI
jgi:hypothetical protein